MAAIERAVQGRTCEKPSLLASLVRGAFRRRRDGAAGDGAVMEEFSPIAAPLTLLRAVMARSKKARTAPPRKLPKIQARAELSICEKDAPLSNPKQLKTKREAVGDKEASG